MNINEHLFDFVYIYVILFLFSFGPSTELFTTDGPGK